MTNTIWCHFGISVTLTPSTDVMTCLLISRANSADITLLGLLLVFFITLHFISFLVLYRTVLLYSVLLLT